VKIDLPAVLKAGLAGDVLGIILGLLTAIPTFLRDGEALSGVLLCCGGALLPLLAGTLYGYFAPGDETPSQGAMGGALAGFAAGALYALFQSLIAIVDVAFTGDPVADLLRTGEISPLAACCLTLLVGPLLGALGGAIWVSRQNRRDRLGAP
jgi:hypothetical protein